jgi:glycosyltransferase involved in cell wall biosynthesis
MLLYLGRIHKAKGLDLLLNSFADVLKSRSEVKLVIVGPDDGFKNDLELQAKNLEISDSIFFTGPMYGADKLSAYVDSDIFVLPSHYEAFGLTILEAWACHVPIIITERCEIAKVASQGGLVVKHRKENLKEAILKLISDDKLRKSLGDRGAELVNNRFNWKMIVCDIEAVYQECVNNRV